MNSTRIRPIRFSLPNAVLLAIGLIGAHAFANVIDEGGTQTIPTNTVYEETLFVGLFNPGNGLIVSNDATLTVESLIIGSGEDSTNNLVSVLGGSRLLAGEVTTNGLSTGGIVAGATDSGSPSITVDHASKLEGDYLYVGFGTNDSGRILLSGEGTELNIGQDAYVGYAGSTNSVDIEKGASMNVGGMLTVGSSIGSNNAVNVSGTLFVNSTNDIHVVEADSDNGISVRNGGTLQIGGDVVTGSLTDLGIDMQNRSTLELGGKLVLTGSQIDTSRNVILNNALSTNTATWQSGSVAIIGATTSYNTLTFTNGASGTANRNMLIGQASTANFNKLNVGGSGSVFTTATDMAVGFSGDKNELNVSDGGQLNALGSLYLGVNSSSTDNKATIGSNAVLHVAEEVIVGANGANNRFTIDQARVDVAGDFILGRKSKNNRYTQTGGTNTVAGDFIIGETAGASGATSGIDTSGNLGSVEKDAFLEVQTLTVGKNADGSVLIINEGSSVRVNGDAVIGEASDDNFIYLEGDDPDTRFTVTGDLIVGNEGGLNRFAVYGGTADISESLYLGASTNQHERENFIHLQTTNAMLNVAGDIRIGASNSVNTLTLAAGAEANVQNLFVGAYEGTSNNVVTISGENNDRDRGWFGYITNSTLNVSNQLVIGSNSGSENAVILRKGGILYVSSQSNLILNGTNNTFTISEEGTLKTHGWDFAQQIGAATNITFESGATLHLLGTLQGTNMVEGGLRFILDGTAASWDTGTDIMYVGKETDNNSLTLTNGASASTLTNLYIGYASSDNTVTVGGAGSMLTIDGDLFIGTETNDSSFNTLAVIGKAGLAVEVNNDAFLYRGGVLKIDSQSQVHVGGDYHQDGVSTLEIGVSSNQVNPNLVVDGTAGFSTSADPEEYPLIRVFDDGIGESNVVTIVQADAITVDDETASSGSIRSNIATNLLMGFRASISNGVDNTFIVLDDFIKFSIADAGNLEGQLRDVANEIEKIAKNGDSGASNMVSIIEGMSSEREVNAAFDDYFGEKKSAAPVHNVLGLGMQKISEQLTLRADSTRTRMGVASAAGHRRKPAGAAGPHQSGQALQGWFTGYGTWGNQSRTDGYDGYDASVNGFLVGADLSVADNLLVGVAGGSGSSTIDKDNGGNSDVRTTYGALYASAGTRDWFADASIMYGGSSVDSKVGTAFDTKADYDAGNIGFYLGGGKEIIGEYLIFVPQASFLANHYTQEEYDETSSVTARKVEEFDTLYLQSSIGCNVSFYTTLGDITLKPELRIHWMHEFNDDEESLSYSLIGGDGTQHTLILQAPEADILKLGAGFSAKMSEYLELRFDLDTRQTGNYSDYTALGSIRYQF